MNLQEMLKAYFELQEKIHDFFGYKEDWKVIPLEDRTEMYWHCISKDEKSRGRVLYSNEPLTPEIIENGNHYEDIIYTQRFLPRFVYRTEKYTMISVDTQTDGNCFLAIFDNSKEIKDVEE